MPLPATDDTLHKLHHLRDLMRKVEGAFVLDHLHPHQLPPGGVPSKDWEGWLIQAGRGSGKTAAIANYVTEHVEGPACLPGKMPHKMALVAPSIGDAVESADRHPICLTSLRPAARLRQRAGGTIVNWPNGSEMKLFGTFTRRDIDRLRAGGNNCLVWVEELAAWPYLREAWDQMQLGLRVGPTPHWVGSTTPKPYPDYAVIVADPNIVITRASTDDNPDLDESFRDRMNRRYAGTSLGAQEIGGELLSEIEGALWTTAIITRVHQTPEMRRVLIGVDPSGGRTETGIVASGRVNADCPCGTDAPYPHAIVLADFTDTTGKPDTWARAVIDGYDSVKADRVVGEANFGGAMVESTIRTIRKSIPYENANAARGKAVRAEPIVALYQQGRVHHLGRFPELETEMVTWVPDESPWSPNRLDALVWAVTKLQLEPSTGGMLRDRTYTSL